MGSWLKPAVRRTPFLNSLVWRFAQNIRQGFLTGEYDDAFSRCRHPSQHACITCTYMIARAGLLIKDKSLKKAKAMVLHFIAQEDPAFGRSSIKQKSAPAPQLPDLQLPTMGGAHART
jgi:hypothetical protein